MPETRPPDARARAALLAVCLVNLGIPLTVTMTGLALDAIRRELGGDLAQLQWVLNAFLLSFAALLLPLGALADQQGRRRLFLIGAVGFSVASLLCALAPDLLLLTVARLLQGAAGALIGATGPALLASAFPAESDRRRAFGLFGGSIGAGLALGAAGGGLVITVLGWRAGFLLQALVVMAGLGAAGRIVDPAPRRRGRFDPAAAAGLGMTLLAWFGYGILGPKIGYGAPATQGLLGTAVLLTVVFARAQRRHRQPLLAPALLQRDFLAAGLLCLALTSFWVTLFYFVPLYLQVALWQTPAEAGLLLLAMLVPLVLAPPLAAHLSPELPVGVWMFRGWALMAAGAAVLYGGTLRAELPILALALFLCGLGSGLISGRLDQLAMAAAPPEHRALAGGAVNTLRVLGDALGALVPGALLSACLTRELAAALPLNPDSARLAGNALAAGNLSQGAALLGLAPADVTPLALTAWRTGMAGVALLLLLFCAAIALACRLRWRAPAQRLH